MENKIFIEDECSEIIGSFSVQWDKQKKIFHPQPTRFWIKEGWLRKSISKLEEKGLISWLERAITEKESTFNQMVLLHRKEIQIRKELLKNIEVPKYVREKLLNTGIGGIQDFDKKPFKVKCLHLWTAYHIGDTRFKNPIGELVLDKIRKLHQSR